jgi:hypothetical protein
MSNVMPPPLKKPVACRGTRDLAHGEKADADRAEHTVEQMHRHGTDWVVELHPVHQFYGSHDDKPRQQPDHESSLHGDECAGSRDRYETRQATVDGHS